MRNIVNHRNSIEKCSNGQHQYDENNGKNKCILINRSEEIFFIYLYEESQFSHSSIYLI